MTDVAPLTVKRFDSFTRRDFENGAVRDEIRRALARIERDAALLRRCAEALKAMIDWFGGPHEDGDCPEDDTCECERVAFVNAVYADLRTAGVTE